MGVLSILTRIPIAIRVGLQLIEIGRLYRRAKADGKITLDEHLAVLGKVYEVVSGLGVGIAYPGHLSLPTTGKSEQVATVQTVLDRAEVVLRAIAGADSTPDRVPTSLADLAPLAAKARNLLAGSDLYDGPNR